MKLRFAALVVVSILVSGCATAPLPTTSGRPEVTVRNRSTAQVRSVVVNQFVDRGFAPVQTDGNQLVFQKEDGAGDALLMGLITNNPESSTRIVITLVDNTPNVRVVGGVAAIGQTNFGRQHVIELSGKGYRQLQAELEQIKARAEQ